MGPCWDGPLREKLKTQEMVVQPARWEFWGGKSWALSEEQDGVCWGGEWQGEALRDQ